MRTFLLPALLILWSPSPAWSRDQPTQCNVETQMSGEARRDQNTIGACHAFAAVALVEAAIFRQSGRHEALSDADLFVSNTVANPAMMARLRQLSRDPSARITEGFFAAVEGNSVRSDLEAALRAGVAQRQTVPWAVTSDNYRNFRAEMVRQMNALREKQRYPSAERQGAAAAKARQEARAPSTPTAKFLSAFIGYLADWGILSRQDAQQQTEDVLQAVELYWMNEAFANEFWAKKTAGLPRSVNTILGLGDVLRIEADRAAVRAKYRLERLRILPARPADAPPGTDLGFPGGSAPDWIRTQLCDRHRPVALSVDLHDVDWEGFAPGSGHAFLITGLRQTDRGPVFKTRNSWNINENRDISLASFKRKKRDGSDRVFFLHTVATPSEKD